MNLNFATRGQIIETYQVGECVVKTWFRRTINGAQGELCTSIATIQQYVNEDGKQKKREVFTDSVTSFVKWNENETPNRHIEKVEKMLKKNELFCKSA